MSELWMKEFPLMTVEELIVKLQALPPGSVVLRGDTEDECAIQSVEVYDGKPWYETAEDIAANRVRPAIIID